MPDLPLSEDTSLLALPAGNGNKPKLALPKSGHSKLSLTSTFQNQGDAPTCPNCGHVAVRNGACYKCLNCGESLGCS